jgi:hypothetical protein
VQMKKELQLREPVEVRVDEALDLGRQRVGHYTSVLWCCDTHRR